MSAVDIVAIKQKDGSIKSTPFYVLFPSRKSAETVYVEINGVLIDKLTMVANSGALYFSPQVTRKRPKSAEVMSLIKEVNERELAVQEGETTQVLQYKIAEEEQQIQLELAEEERLMLSPELRNEKATAKEIDRTLSPLTPRRSSSMDKLNSALKNFFHKDNPACNNSSTPSANKREETNIVLCKEPTPHQFASIDLKEGENSIKFTSAISKITATAKLFFWNHDSKIILSDIDGTITRTDMRGLFFYKFGYDWTHNNVVDLFKGMADNGYQFVYLTARSVKTQGATRIYLDKIKVPNGPILCAPHNLFGCVSTEFWKTTSEGKMMHLNELRALFDRSYNPFVAGFGNRVHDHMCYKAIGIIPDRIYIVNKSSEVTVNGNRTSYDSLLKITPILFPSIKV